MRRRLLASYLALTLIVLLLLEVPLAVGYGDRARDEVSTGLQRDAFVIANYAEETLEGDDHADLQRYVTDYQHRSGGRVLLVDAHGHVVADSASSGASSSDGPDRAQLGEALAGHMVTGSGGSTSLGDDSTYVIAPVTTSGRTIGAVGISYPAGQLDARIHRYWAVLAGIGLASLAAAALVGVVLSQWVARPLQQVREAAISLGHGDLSARSEAATGPPEVREVSAAFDDMARRLEELVNAQQAFVADASHQLRTPLTALRLRLENLASEVSTADADEDLDGARRETHRLSRMVDGLLTLARADRRRDGSDRHVVHVGTALAERIAIWQPIADEYGLDLVGERSDLEIDVSPDRLAQILDNLLANATDASPRGASSGSAPDARRIASGSRSTWSTRGRASTPSSGGTPSTGSGARITSARTIRSRPATTSGAADWGWPSCASSCWPMVARSSCSSPTAAASTRPCDSPPEPPIEADTRVEPRLDGSLPRLGRARRSFQDRLAHTWRHGSTQHSQPRTRSGSTRHRLDGGSRSRGVRGRRGAAGPPATECDGGPGSARNGQPGLDPVRRRLRRSRLRRRQRRRHQPDDRVEPTGAGPAGIAGPGAGVVGRVVRPSSARFWALGTNVVVLCARPECLDAVVAAVGHEIDAIDLACSRFRPDSELMALNTSAGRASQVSPLLLRAIEVAVRAAELTDGRVDPTIGGTLRRLGYDRDFRSVPPDGPALEIRLDPAPGWREITIDAETRTVQTPTGTELDLGATAKALAADLAAQAGFDATGAGVLVSIGGDISTAGPAPDPGWSVLVTDDHAAPLDHDGARVTISTGGLATSSTTVRAWRRGDEQLHHVIDPSSSRPVDPHWRTVSVAASTCVDANTASTACIVLGARAPGWLDQRDLPGRLVSTTGEVLVVAGWPAQ